MANQTKAPLRKFSERAAPDEHIQRFHGREYHQGLMVQRSERDGGFWYTANTGGAYKSDTICDTPPLSVQLQELAEEHIREWAPWERVAFAQHLLTGDSPVQPEGATTLDLFAYRMTDLMTEARSTLPGSGNWNHECNAMKKAAGIIREYIEDECIMRSFREFNDEELSEYLERERPDVCKRIANNVQRSLVQDILKSESNLSDVLSLFDDTQLDTVFRSMFAIMCKRRRWDAIRLQISALFVAGSLFPMEIARGLYRELQTRILTHPK